MRSSVMRSLSRRSRSTLVMEDELGRRTGLRPGGAPGTRKQDEGEQRGCLQETSQVFRGFSKA